MKRAAIFLALYAASAAAESNFSAPLVGVARDTQGQLRLVYGVAGNFILRDGILRDGMASQVLDWAFARDGGLVRTSTEWIVLDSNGKVGRRRAVPRGEAVMSPDAAFFPGTGELWQVRAAADRRVLVALEAIDGRVLALGAANPRETELAVCRGSHPWVLTIDLNNGAVTRETAVGGAIGAHGCAGAWLSIGGTWLLADGHELLIQTSGSAERRVQLSGSLGAHAQLSRAGEHWAQVEIAGAPPAMVRITAGTEQLYSLPAAGALQ
jgi:hypothetical protein